MLAAARADSARRADARAHRAARARAARRSGARARHAAVAAARFARRLARRVGDADRQREAARRERARDGHRTRRARQRRARAPRDRRRRRNARDGDGTAALRVRRADTVETGGARVRAGGARRDGGATGDVSPADVRVRQDSLVSYAALGAYSQPASGVHVVQLDSLRATFDTLVWRLDASGVGAPRPRLASRSIRSSCAARAAGGCSRRRRCPKEGPIFARRRRRTACASRRCCARCSATPTPTASCRRARIVRHARAADDRGRSRDTARRALSRHARSRRGRDARLSRPASRRSNAVAHDSSGTTGAERARASLPFDLALGERERIASARGSARRPRSCSTASRSRRCRCRSRKFAGRAGQGRRATCTVRGTWREPEYAGRAGLRDGALTLPSIGMSVNDGDGRPLARRRHAASRFARRARARAAARERDGRPAATPSHPFVRMSASGEDLRVMNQRRGLVDADADITVVGPLDALRVTGRGEMLGGYLALKQFRKDLLRVKSPGDLSFLTVFDTTAPPERQRARRARAARAAEGRDRRRSHAGDRPRQLLSQPSRREHGVLHRRMARRWSRISTSGATTSGSSASCASRAVSPSSARSPSCRRAAASPSVRTRTRWASCSRSASGWCGRRDADGSRCSSSRAARRRRRRSDSRAGRSSRSAAAS